MESKRVFFGFRTLVTAASIMVLIAGLRAGQPILIPFLFAVFLSILGSAPVTWLQDRRIPASLSILLVTILLIGVFVCIGFFLGTSVNQFTSEIPYYRVKLNETAQSLSQWLVSAGIETDLADLSESADPGYLIDLLGATLKGLVGAVSKMVLVVILMVFMLIEAAEFRVKVRAALGNVVDFNRFSDVTSDVQRYLAIKTFTSFLTGTAVGVWTYYMRVDFPLLWAVIAFLFNYVPVIGSIVASVPAILLALIQSGFTTAIVVGVGYLVVNIGISNFLEPIFLGRRLKISPLIVLLSLLFWGWVWGPAGALMSVPLTMIVKILLEHSHEFRWIAVLMDSKPQPEAKS